MAQGDKSNEPNWAIEINGLSKDIEHILSEIEKLRKHVDKGLERREKTVDRQLLALEAAVSEKLDKLSKRFDNYTTIDSFRPVTKWLTIIGASIITFVLTVLVSVINFFFTLFHSGGKPPTPGLGE